MKIIIILIIFILSGCITPKQIDDTEHLWKGANGIEFYE
tara:strand:- start:2132 stop:2248 length:117 start_codon:yes stop_codon:yes gene_type:complete